LKNRLAFPTAGGVLTPNQLSTLQSPIQKFRWVHFPRNADLLGEFMYRVTPVFMSADDALSYGETQTVAIELRRETYPGLLNVAFTRGFVASQAFVDLYESAGPISTLLPPNADVGLDLQDRCLRVDQLQLARLLRPEQQRARAPGRDRGGRVPNGLRGLLAGAAQGLP